MHLPSLAQRLTSERNQAAAATHNNTHRFSGRTEYPISNTEYRILIGGGHFGFDIPFSIFDIRYWIFNIRCHLPNLRLQLLEEVLDQAQRVRA